MATFCNIAIMPALANNEDCLFRPEWKPYARATMDAALEDHNTGTLHKASPAKHGPLLCNCAVSWVIQQLAQFSGMSLRSIKK